MSITIQEVSNHKDLKAFIKFPFKLYKGNKYYVPPIIDFELSTLRKDKNPAFDNSDAVYYIVKKNNEIVGRIAGIVINEELSTKKLMRFGWIDFIDDEAVSKVLFEKIIQWGSSKGAEKIHGPMGFTDLDFEGSLISGFDKLATQAGLYNYEYYHKHYEALGFEKACDWYEIRGRAPKKVPRRLDRAASLIRSRFQIEAKKFTKTKEIKKYAPGVFDLLNEAYSNLYAYYPLSEKQKKYYIDQYFGFIRKEYVTIVVDQYDKVIAFGISLPSLSRAFQKAKGSLFPIGFIHVLKAFYSNQHIDLFLVAVNSEWQKKGAIPLIFHELLSTYIQNGVEYISSGPMMENNSGVINLWKEYEDVLDPKSVSRRCYIKAID